MGVEQLPGRVREFTTYLNGLLARLDQGAGWCGVFWQRDPDGMRACLDGWEVPPWDVVEALLQDLEGKYGPRAAAQETERARTLHDASLTAFDGRPGGRDALGDRLDVMLREQRYAAERQAELGRQLHEAGSQEEAEAVRLDLAWARNDHDRATARCAEIRRRLEDLDRSALGAHAQESRDFPADGTGGAGALRQDGSEARSASAGRHAGPYAPPSREPDPYASSSREPNPYAASARQPDPSASGPSSAAHGQADPHAPAAREPGPAAGRRPAWSAFAERPPVDADHAGGRPDDGYAAGRSGGDHTGGHSDVGYGAGRSGGDHADGRSGDGCAPEPDASRAEPEPQPDALTPAPAPPVPKQRAKRRPRGSARFAGMMETEPEATPPAAAPPAAPPVVPAQATKGRTPRGARFAGAAAQPARADAPRREPLDDAARQDTVDTVESLVRLRAEGRTGEAHALLVEAAYWPAARFPLLAAQLHRAGLDADWATLLWEAASLPADRLVAAADALVAAGRTADGSQMLRQGVARPAPEIGAAVQGLAAEGRHREIRALLDAYVRVRTPEEAARSVEADPVHLVPLLLQAAQGASEERYWDLVHALRVAGFAT
jgi:hypothetical protein